MVAMLELEGVLQRFDWGTKTAIWELLGREPDGHPVAEYWLGAHELSPATTPDGPLDEVLRTHPEYLGDDSQRAFDGQLPFLFKVLSAAHPISLQAHPDRAQAEDGFARENAAHIGLTDPHRVYRDSWPKPEILIALGPFEVLTGFREPLETAELFAGLGLSSELSSLVSTLIERKGAAALAEVFLDALSLEGERLHLLDVAAAAAMRHASDDGPVGDFARDAVRLDDVFPGDRAILAALLLNRVTLAPGEACYVPPGQMHVYLRGTGIEVMANSDNVIRGGLTGKHVDVGELVRVVDFEPTEVDVTHPLLERPGVERYPTPCDEFAVWRLNLTPSLGSVMLPEDGSARIAFATSGRLTATSAGQSAPLNQGDALLIPANDPDARISGTGTVFLAASGPPHTGA
jgi:mannose-6-phosphate isomerase